jgi:hypothetical protein
MYLVTWTCGGKVHAWTTMDVKPTKKSAMSEMGIDDQEFAEDEFINVLDLDEQEGLDDGGHHQSLLAMAAGRCMDGSTCHGGPFGMMVDSLVAYLLSLGIKHGAATQFPLS